MNKLEHGYVDKVTMTTTGSDGHPLIRVDIRQTRQPEVGDKFASRHAQKGTVGAIIPDEDMPFDPSTGMSPDVIMNSHAIPTRMTVRCFSLYSICGDTKLTNDLFTSTLFFRSDKCLR